MSKDDNYCIGCDISKRLDLRRRWLMLLQHKKYFWVWLATWVGVRVLTKFLSNLLSPLSVIPIKKACVLPCPRYNRKSSPIIINSKFQINCTNLQASKIKRNKNSKCMKWKPLQIISYLHNYSINRILKSLVKNQFKEKLRKSSLACM